MSEHEKTVPADQQASQKVQDEALDQVSGGAGQPIAALKRTDKPNQDTAADTELRIALR